MIKTKQVVVASLIEQNDATNPQNMCTQPTYSGYVSILLKAPILCNT